MEKKHKGLIFSDLPRLVSLPSHFDPAPVWVTPDMGPDVKLGVIAVDVSKLVGRYITDAHVHDCAEVYMAPSPNRGDMVFEITLDDETYTVESPLAVYVPAGVTHRFKTLKAERERSYFFGILLDMKGS
jgi:hypothetical protein